MKAPAADNDRKPHGPTGRLRCRGLRLSLKAKAKALDVKPNGSRIARLDAMLSSPPTIDFITMLGMRDVSAVCPRCGEQFTVPISALDLPGETALAQIPSHRPLTCPECSASGDIDLEAMGFDAP